ncbi:MAG: hypothetical protein M1825_006302 [Sarcosagium campestre]|nr:MAG: hypothetical protein M1825_006302 [Sarcosagium campestre]
MPRQLEPLLLPKIVEARKSQEHKDADLDIPELSNSFHTPNSSNSSASTSDFSLPVTPTMPARGHARFPISSSAISFDLMSSSYGSKIQASPPSPSENVEMFHTGMHSLPDVKEESVVGKEDDYDMLDGTECVHDCSCRRASNSAGRAVMLPGPSMSMPSPSDYDLDDDFLRGDDAISFRTNAKKRRGGDSLSGIATRIGNRLPSFSRRWKSRKVSRNIDISRESAPSRAGSSRTSSSEHSLRESTDSRDGPRPLTPAKSTVDADDEIPFPGGKIDVERANNRDSVATEGMATTPLLPPLMVPETAPDAQPAIQSPLQSPTIAENLEPLSHANSPAIPQGTPQIGGMPSPPMSRKPSATSIPHQVVGQLVPASEIPGIKLADPDDEWAHKLGHANFDIHPEPYLPDELDAEACKQLRANWDHARCNYTKHLFRTGEHYGVTSKTYKLTEQKWHGIDAQWKSNYDRTCAQTSDDEKRDPDAAHQMSDEAPPVAMLTKMPSLNDPRSEGKFPKLGDEDIVGPMVQAVAQSQSNRRGNKGRSSRKSSFMRFLHSPTSILSGRSSAAGHARAR